MTNKKIPFHLSCIHSLWNLKQRLLSLLGGKTVGINALIIQNENVLLVRQTYCAGWYLVGGSVQKKETPLQCIKRELFEEVGITTTAVPTLFGVYYNNVFKRDGYVILYILEKFEMQDVISNEVAEKKWFHYQHLPEDIKPGAKRRIEEYFGLKEMSDRW